MGAVKAFVLTCQMLVGIFIIKKWSQIAKDSLNWVNLI